jgi:tripartite-type tricarboxylate transporter receptor subunit TctC
VPYAPGGTTDFVTRAIGQKLSESWAQPVVILNKPGASGSIGAELAMQAPPDGYTLAVTGYANRLLLFSPTPPVANPAKDLIPVAIVAQAPLLLLAHPDFPAKSFREFLALAKGKPGTINYASIGNGSPSHLAMEMVKKATGAEVTHIPYKGSGPALIDVFTWTALYTPPGVAPDKVEKLRLEVARILKLPDIMERFAAQGAIIPETMTQAQAAAFIDADIAGYRKFILEANIKPE